MEFWGVEVKPGESLKVTPDCDKIFQISQASLGEVKNRKGADSVPIRVHINDQNFVIGTLSAEGIPQLQLDLVFEKEFELSHDWKNGSVYFFGHTTYDPVIDDEDFCDSDCSSDEEEDELDLIENGSLEIDGGGAKPAKSKPTPDKPKSKSTTKPKFTAMELESDEDDDDDEDEDDDDELATESSGSSDDEEVGKNMKRPFKSASKAPGPAKKARSDSPQKTDVMKGTHTKQSTKILTHIRKSKELSSDLAIAGQLKSHKAKHGRK